MSERLVDVLYRLDGERVRHKLGAIHFVSHIGRDPCKLGCVAVGSQDIVSLSIGIDVYVLGSKRSEQLRQCSYARAMNDKAVESVAHTHTPCLAILYYARSHSSVAKFVEVGMHYAGTCLNDRNACRIAHKVDQSSAATRYAEVDIAHSGEHLVCRLMRCRQQAHYVFVDVMRPKHFLDECNDGTVGHVGILSTLQYAGIASLETEREDIEADIGTCLVHHSNDTIRHTLLAQKESVGQRLLVEHLAKRIVQVSHITQCRSNVVQSLGRELQTVVQRIVLRHTTKVVGIGSKQLLYMRLDSVGKVQQYGCAVSLGKTRQCEGGCASGME